MTATSALPALLSAEWGRVDSTCRRGRQISYRDSGGEGPVMFLVMGLGADSTRWAAHVEHWQRSARCVAVDNAGTGGTAPAQPLSTGEMAEDCAAVLDRLGLGSVAAIGVSMGGAVLQQLALRHPERLRKQVLVATWPSATSYMRAAFSHLVRVQAETPAEVFTQTLQLFIWGSEYVDAHFADLEEEAGRAVSTMASADFEAQAEACLYHDARDLLSRICTPTLITHGTEDRLVPVRVGRTLGDAIPDSQMVEFAECGHAHHWERLDEFNTLVLDWVGEGT